VEFLREEIDNHSHFEPGAGLSGSGIEVEVGLQGRVKAMTCDAMIVSIGRRSAAGEILRNPGLSPLPGSNPVMSRPGLVVIGDARTGSLGQVGMAVGDGLHAAAEVAGFLGKGVGAAMPHHGKENG
jgi:thioredoxin reductase